MYIEIMSSLTAAAVVFLAGRASVMGGLKRAISNGPEVAEKEKGKTRFVPFDTSNVRLFTMALYDSHGTHVPCNINLMAIPMVEVDGQLVNAQKVVITQAKGDIGYAELTSDDGIVVRTSVTSIAALTALLHTTDATLDPGEIKLPLVRKAY